MIFRVLLVIALVYFSLMAIFRFLKRPGKNGGPPSADEIRSRKITLGLVAFALLTVFLASIGRLHWIGALFATVLPLLKNLHDLWNYLFRDKQKAESIDNKPRPPEPMVSSRQQALDILGLEDPCSEEDILAAHKRLIQKLHPDRGGNDFLAAQINAARDYLMKQRT